MEGLGVTDNNSIGRRRKKLTALEKWQIYQETNAKGAPVGEILRRHGLYSSELTKIRKQVEEAALRELGRKRYSRKPETVIREALYEMCNLYKGIDRQSGRGGIQLLSIKPLTRKH